MFWNNGDKKQAMSLKILQVTYSQEKNWPKILIVYRHI
jgi:hypothetical protein